MMERSYAGGTILVKQRDECFPYGRCFSRKRNARLTNVAASRTLLHGNDAPTFRRPTRPQYRRRNAAADRDVVRRRGAHQRVTATTAQNGHRGSGVGDALTPLLLSKVEFPSRAGRRGFSGACWFESKAVNAEGRERWQERRVSLRSRTATRP